MLIVNDSKLDSKPAVTEIIVKGVVQKINGNSPPNFAVSQNASLKLFVSPPSPQENSHITISGNLANVAGGSKVSGQDIIISLYSNSSSKQTCILCHATLPTDNNGGFNYAHDLSNNPPGHYFASAGAYGLKTIQKFEIQPHIPSPSELLTQFVVIVGLIGTILTIFKLAYPKFKGKRKSKELSNLIHNIDEAYKKDAREKNLRRICSKKEMSFCKD
jgi:hypothetical protein